MSEQGFEKRFDYDKDHQIDDLRKELEYFQKEKERVRAIVGQIGSMPTQRNKIMNIIFFVVVIACIPLSLITEGKVQHLILEVAVAAISLKLIYIIHSQGRVNHFQLWILTSIEWRMNEMMREIAALDKRINKLFPENDEDTAKDSSDG